MSEYSRRNRGKVPEHDDFDWEKFDRQTAKNSTISSADSEPLRRRRTTSSADDTRRKRQRVYDDAAVERKQAPVAASDIGKPAQTRKRKKKRLTQKQIDFRRKLRRTILVIVLVFVVVFSGMFVGMYAAVSREIKEMNIEGLALNYTSSIYYLDDKGKEHELSKLRSDTSRIWVDSGDIAPCFKDAIVSIEDERFYKHKGVDLKRTFGATVKFVASKMGLGDSSYGGSTITQQVIKNITSEDDFKATRKIKEIVRAIALENQLTKDEILTLYCNVAYFANGCSGVESAANAYFNKSAADLNIQEAASIAGITQFPSRYDPIANPENNTEKRNTVLQKMYELGKITKEEYDKAVNSKLELNKEHIRQRTEPTSYFEDQIVNDVINDLVERKNYTQEFAERQVYNGGCKIYATIDPQIQSIMENVFENTSNFPGGGKSEAAMVVLDPYTGEIKGLIGGLGEKTDIRGFNRATQAIRQPGSAIKPISVYGPAIDLGKITESDIIKDEPITIGSDDWKPKNSYSGFKGNMTVKEAVGRSANIPAVKVLEKVGLSNSFGYLKNKFNISTLQDKDKNYSSLALGGLTQGVTVKDMAAAYGVFVNSGKYITPHTYTKVVDASGEVILENFKNETQAISEASAYITADLLSAPVNMAYGTAGRARLNSGLPAYGKTGTTDDNFDKWFVGFTPYYVGAVWFGFDTPSSLSAAGITNNPCVTAWKLVFDKIAQNQSYKTLEKPSSVKEVRVCAVSGQLAGPTCQSIKSYFAPGTEPKKTCTNHYSGEEKDDDDEEESNAPDGSKEPVGSHKPDSTPKPTNKPVSTPSTNGGQTGDVTPATSPETSGGGNEPTGDIITE